MRLADDEHALCCTQRGAAFSCPGIRTGAHGAFVRMVRLCACCVCAHVVFVRISSSCARTTHARLYALFVYLCDGQGLG